MSGVPPRGTVPESVPEPQAMASGKVRSAHDMIIAATAAATGRVLLTTNASAAFDQLPGVRAEVLE
jgi:tRNA(fMet)-specific endonuclease VapC